MRVMCTCTHIDNSASWASPWSSLTTTKFISNWPPQPRSLNINRLLVNNWLMIWGDLQQHSDNKSTWMRGRRGNAIARPRHTRRARSLSGALIHSAEKLKHWRLISFGTTWRRIMSLSMSSCRISINLSSGPTAGYLFNFCTWLRLYLILGRALTQFLWANKPRILTELFCNYTGLNIVPFLSFFCCSCLKFTLCYGLLSVLLGQFHLLGLGKSLLQQTIIFPGLTLL